MHVQGRCHCGEIAYEAEIDPAGVSVCHCTDCQ
ncbi:MAG TPA: GFA family protein, partial [Casimicrobiaceae bacterium]|nr:GFA family protein [Casimicrobiaceae bacterium]